MAGQRSRSDTGRTGATEREHPADAGIALTLHRVTVRDNGFAAGRDDFDGIRINQGAAGDVVLTVRQTQVVNNAADGIEIDEKGSGSVFTTVHNSVFNDNGTQPQLPEDLEDGFDIDEAGPGRIEVRLVHVSVSANENQGIDLDEEGSGSVDVRGTDVRAIGNRNEGVKISEDADLEDVALESLPSGSGAVVFDFHQLTVRDTRDDDGVQIEEFGDGTLRGRLVNSSSTGNNGDDLIFEQVVGGEGLVRLQSTTFGSLATAGVTVVENGKP